jgi:hypothetical protein
MEHAANIEKAVLAQMGDPDSPLIRRITAHNQILLHNYRAAADKACRCQLAGCEERFTVTLIPNQILYPKYCESHRSEYRRAFHLLRQGILEACGGTEKNLGVYSLPVARESEVES